METYVKPSPIDPKTLKPIMYCAGLTLHACQGLEYGLKVLRVAMVELGFGASQLEKRPISSRIEQNILGGKFSELYSSA
jgi:hypothetical protein